MKTVVSFAIVLQMATFAFAAGNVKLYAPLEFSDGTPQSTATAQGPVGLQGAKGDTGSSGFNSLISMLDESAGSNCTYGGVKIQVGLDSSRDGVLDLNEITQTKYVCSGVVPVVSTVSDPSTGLVWQKADDNIKRNWYDAQTYCSGLNLGGFSSGWRLPSRPELQALNISPIYSQIQGTHFTDLGGGNYAGMYWSITSYDAAQAYHVFLTPNQAEGWANKSGWTNLVRCVRP